MPRLEVGNRKPLDETLVSQKYKIHPYRLKTALRELLKNGEIKVIKNSTSIDLYKSIEEEENEPRSH